MQYYKPQIEFKEINEDTYEKEKQRKLEDQQKWQMLFMKIVADYFEEKKICQVHNEFVTTKHRLDCFIPASGHFVCGGRAPGKRKGKKKKKKTDEAATMEKNLKQQEEQQGCGKSWNSNLTLTKFVCTIEGDHTLIVKLREFGQRCRHCQRRYENPSFLDHTRDAMMWWLLEMVLEGIFGIVDKSIDVPYDDLHTSYRPSRQARKLYKHIQENCEACDKGKQCGRKRKERRRKKKKNGSTASSG